MSTLEIVLLFLKFPALLANAAAGLIGIVLKTHDDNDRLSVGGRCALWTWMISGVVAVLIFGVEAYLEIEEKSAAVKQREADVLKEQQARDLALASAERLGKVAVTAERLQSRIDFSQARVSIMLSVDSQDALLLPYAGRLLRKMDELSKTFKDFDWNNPQQVEERHRQTTKQGIEFVPKKGYERFLTVHRSSAFWPLDGEFNDFHEHGLKAAEVSQFSLTIYRDDIDPLEESLVLATENTDKPDECFLEFDRKDHLVNLYLKTAKCRIERHSEHITSAQDLANAKISVDSRWVNKRYAPSAKVSLGLAIEGTPYVYDSEKAAGWAPDSEVHLLTLKRRK